MELNWKEIEWNRMYLSKRKEWEKKKSNRMELSNLFLNVLK